MAQPDESTATKPSTPPAPAAVPAKEGSEFVGREAWLSAGSNLAEAVVEVEGLGKVIVREVTARIRAELMTMQSKGLIAEVGKMIDHLAAQKLLLEHGVVDPASPQGARQPLFKAGDIDQVMSLGASKVEKIIDKIEELSRLGKYQTSAEGNSAPAPKDAGSSG